MNEMQITSKSLILSLAIAAFFISIEYLVGYFAPTSRTYQLLFLGAIRLVEIWLFISIIGTSSLGLEKNDLLQGFIRGLLWSLAFGAMVLIIAEALWLWGINPLKMMRSKLPEKLPELIVFYCVGGLIAPVAEEIFFRGIVYGFFRRRGIFAALFLSTLLFFTAHPKANLPQLIGGIVFAIAYETEKRLMTPIVIHALGNMAIFTISLL